MRPTEAWTLKSITWGNHRSDENPRSTSYLYTADLHHSLEHRHPDVHAANDKWLRDLLGDDYNYCRELTARNGEVVAVVYQRRDGLPYPDPDTPDRAAVTTVTYPCPDPPPFWPPDVPWIETP